MPGGQFDSSKTRVAPVLDALKKRSPADWVKPLLELTSFGAPESLDLTYLQGYWGANEKGLYPPISLLSWLIRHPEALRGVSDDNPDRKRLFTGEPVSVQEALCLLRSGNLERGWHLFEGRTYPDAVIETPEALIVIEGKRTEVGATTETKWLLGRHQIWRHIDAAWEQKGNRCVFGFFVVEAEKSSTDVPNHWKRIIHNTLQTNVLESSFPHRSLEERAQIQQCFLGATTWQAICQRFALPLETLPDHVAEDQH